MDSGASRKIDNVLAEDERLFHVLPLAVHLSYMLKSYGWEVGGLQDFMSAPVPI